jgi:hypothetical protein
MRLRLGEILVRRGVLSEAECQAVLERQRESNRPFGVIAEELFGVPPRVLQDAWAEQYEQMAGRVDPLNERVSPEAVGMLRRRQAWQFRMLPLRFEQGELLLCTTRAHLPRALNFAYRSIGPNCSFVLAETRSLGEALQKHYPWQGPMDVMGMDLLAKTDQRDAGED